MKDGIDLDNCLDYGFKVDHLRNGINFNNRDSVYFDSSIDHLSISKSKDDIVHIEKIVEDASKLSLIHI